MAPLKPLANFKSRHFSFLVPIDPSSSSKSIVAKTSILLAPSLRGGSSKSLFIVDASSGTTIGAKEPISFDSNPIVPKPKKIKKVEGELNRVFQDIWVAKLHWLEAMMGPNGKLSIVKCKVCSYVEKGDKLLVSKFDGL
jgi:hypothetical protein